MPFIPVPTAVQCVVHQRLDSQVVLNDLYFSHPGGVFTGVEMAALATALFNYWAANMLPLQSAQLTLERVAVRDLNIDTGLIVESIGAITPGGQSNDFLPNNVAFTTSFRTGLAGRSFRGRNYFAGLTEQLVTANLIDAATAAAIVDAYAGMVGLGTVSAGWLWGVVSRFTGGAPRAQGVITPITTVLAVDNIVDSQRRRLPKRGA